MSLKKNVCQLLLPGLLLGACSLVLAQEPSSTPADNTKVNQQDRNTNAPTGDQQKNNLSDRELARQVRRSIMSDKSLSTSAHNLKVIAQNGQVTLKGPVRSEDEKKSIESKAAEIAGADKVTSDLAVKPKS
jgi:osmotically-inducible protein OsmY